MRKSLQFVVLLILSLAYFQFAVAAEKKAAQMPPAIVSMVQAKPYEFQNQIQLLGDLQADQGIMVRPEVAGRVTQIFFKSGEFVEQGTPLLQLNPDILQAAVNQYQAQVTLDQQSFRRMQDLYNKRVSSKADLDTAVANLSSSEAALAKAKAELAQTLIRAPFSGRLGLRLVSLGDYVTAGQNIVQLQKTDPILVDFNVPEAYLDQIKVGDKMTIRSDAFSGSYSGKVDAFDAAINLDTRTLGARAEIANPKGLLIPGAAVTVEFFFNQQQAAVSVPQTSLVYSPQGDFVYRVVDGKAVPTVVKIAKQTNTDLIITEGLKPGDVVVSAGVNKVYPGAIVMTPEQAMQAFAKEAKK